VKKILVVTHQATSEPGLVGQLLQAEGCTLALYCPAIGTALPKQLDIYDGVVIFGGPMSANDDNELPFIRTELDWIPLVLDAQKPFLGICLGAQMLARVLGATVAPHPEDWREIGYVPIFPTIPPTPVDRPTAHPSTPPHPNPLASLTQVYHWHKEGFDLPQDTILLATGDRFANQAFRYRDNAYGLQFHPEITLPMIERWTNDAADQLTLPGAQSRQEQLQNHDRYAAAVASWLAQFLKQWLDEAAQE
jgi:GMP synthase (glutamine-hydrolysing)